jgi:hypothetical protein
MKEKEVDIQKAICTYLQMLENQNKLFFFRSGSGTVKTEKGSYFKSGKPGVPDISVIIDGRYIGLEVKTEKGKLTQIQEDCHQAIERVGGRCYVVRSVDDAIKIIESGG